MDNSKLTPNVREVIELLERYCGDIELVSYGLAPNPFGFCYEVYNQYEEVPTRTLIRLDALLGLLTTDEENTIKQAYLGV